MKKTKMKLSIPRLLLSLLIVAGSGWYALFSIQDWRQTRALSNMQPWFASYVDVTVTPEYAFEEMAQDGAKNAMLSFIVASNEGGDCTPTWGGVYDLQTANNKLDLQRRIARYEQQGGSVSISFGGLKHRELAVACTDQQALERAYRIVIEEYDVTTIDLDLELQGLTDQDAAKRRANAIAAIQKDRRSQGKALSVWVTLPVAPQGLTQDGTNAVSTLLQGGVDIAGVNVMTMNYGTSREKDMDMFTASKQALEETHRQLNALYRRQNIFLSERTLWSKLGATPMIGQNDIQEEIFTLDDARNLRSFANEKGMRRLSMWSANRDIACSQNYTQTQRVSDSCSGIPQKRFEFASILRNGFDGQLATQNDLSTTNTELPNPSDIVDDPATSPYQIWTDTGAYLQGTKVVWRKNVYEAKWWTRGDVPDNPVLQTWETPWKLIGPVLPGEKPIVTPTLPVGTYPEWNGETVYDTGSRVLFKGTPYEAKWWTKGASPEASTSNPDSSPWVPLTQEQINKLLRQS